MEVADTGTLLDISLNEAVNNEILLVLLLLLPLLSELDFSLIVVDTGTLLDVSLDFVDSIVLLLDDIAVVVDTGTPLSFSLDGVLDI